MARGVAAPPLNFQRGAPTLESVARKLCETVSFFSPIALVSPRRISARLSPLRPRFLLPFPGRLPAAFRSLMSTFRRIPFPPRWSLSVRLAARLPTGKHRRGYTCSDLNLNPSSRSVGERWRGNSWVIGDRLFGMRGNPRESARVLGDRFSAALLSLRISSLLRSPSHASAFVRARFHEEANVPNTSVIKFERCESRDFISRP